MVDIAPSDKALEQPSIQRLSLHPRRVEALAHERDGHRMGADALACDAAGGVGGVEP